jgi:hypothetical protein
MARQEHEKEKHMSFGITSCCQDGKHIYFGDCDKVLTRLEMKEVISALQEKGLSEILVIATTNGYNFVSFDKLSLDEIRETNDSIAYMDTEFNKYNYKRGYYTLRMGLDKYLLCMYADTSLLRPVDNSKSNAHRIFFENMFEIHIEKDAAYDNKTWFQTVFYEDTKKR